MIIGYYQQIFLGGVTYYKLSKKDDKGKYKIEYSHSAVPNYIPEAELYIKNAHINFIPIIENDKFL